MVVVVLPGNVDDPTAPSGGNAYDRQVCAGLVATGRPVREIAVPGAWPRPDRTSRAALAGLLATLADGTVVLIDGLVACGVPEVVGPHADRLRLAVLVHLPLADETGLDPAEAAALELAERAVLGSAAAVIATSDATARQLATRHSLSADRIRVALPGVAPAPLASRDPAGRRLLCVASVTPRKGHDVLVEALATVTDLGWECVCVGALTAAAYVDQVRQRIAYHRLGDRVTLAGPRAAATLAGTYADADLLILPASVLVFRRLGQRILQRVDVAAQGQHLVAQRFDGGTRAQVERAQIHPQHVQQGKPLGRGRSVKIVRHDCRLGVSSGKIQPFLRCGPTGGQLTRHRAHLCCALSSGEALHDGHRIPKGRHHHGQPVGLAGHAAGS